MALVKTKLQKDVETTTKKAFNALLEGLIEQGKDGTALKVDEIVKKFTDIFAPEIAAHIDEYIKSADVLPGIQVTTAGSASAQTGTTTSKGKLA